MDEVPSKDELLRTELDEAYRALRDAGDKAVRMRARLGKVTAALYVCLKADLPDDVRQEALDVLEAEDG